jgi:hypothetical protein
MGRGILEAGGLIAKHAIPLPNTRRRVKPRGAQNAPNVNKSLSVQSKRVHGRAPDGRMADNANVVGVPGEVRIPPLVARMEKGNSFSCSGVDVVSANMF